ncbi:MAG: Gfo/Idh/MocA family oxidoreductase, partial [Acidobacteriaceae bacterium]
MTHPLRIGLVGAGFAARFHLHNLRRVYSVPLTIAGVTARSPETREAFAREFSIPAFDSFEAF